MKNPFIYIWFNSSDYSWEYPWYYNSKESYVYFPIHLMIYGKLNKHIWNIF